MRKTQNALFLGFVGIGDTLLATPAIRLLRAKRKDLRITAFIVSAGAREILSANPDVDEVIFVEAIWKRPFALMHALCHLRKKRFDSVVTIYPTSRIIFNGLTFFTGAPMRIVHDYGGDFIRKLSFLQNVRVPVLRGGHSVIQNVNLLKPLGVNAPSGADLRLRLDLTPDSLRRADDFLAKNGISPDMLLIGFHAGSGGMTYKRWPLERFVSLAGKLMREHGTYIVFFCGPDEEHIRDALTKDGLLVYAGSSILETAALISRCRVIVTNDSSLMHVAVSQNVPVVGIFGPTDSKKTGPFTENKREVVSRLSCSPCYDPAAHRKFRCKWGDIRCLKAVSVDEVFSEIKDFIKQTGDSN